MKQKLPMKMVCIMKGMFLRRTKDALMQIFPTYTMHFKGCARYTYFIEYEKVLFLETESTYRSK
jgi:hypothetical protein